MPHSFLTAPPKLNPILIGVSLLLAATSTTFGMQQPAVAIVTPTVETTPVPSEGDAADDPCIWIHPTDPSLSLIIGTDKQGGMAVYDLDGAELQYVSGIVPNNVDLRYNFPLGGERVALVGFSNKLTNGIGLYKVNPVSRLLENVAARDLLTGGSVNGFCMYHSPISGKYYCFITSSGGQVQQWELFDNGHGLVDALQVRAFDVGSSAEGCVADDQFADFYIGEEEEAIWKYGAEPDAYPSRALVDSLASNRLKKDIEGLAIYYASDSTGYLIVSSQGAHNFAVYTRERDNQYVMTFAIAEGNGIDGVTGTDGIDVTNFSLGSAFSSGVFVAQDGKNDVGNQNFKLVSWESIAYSIGPALKIDTAWDPRQVGSVAADFIGNAISGCVPLTVNFIDQSTGPVISWFWEFGDGATSTERNPSHTYDSTGAYTVKLTVSSRNHRHTMSKASYITVNPGPARAEFASATTSGCAPVTINFTDQSTGPVTAWFWEFGDGVTSTERNPVHTYANAGSYTVKLTVSTEKCNHTTSKAGFITVHAVPTAAFASSITAGCAPLTANFTDQSSGPVIAWSWNFGDGETSSERNPSHTYTTSDTFSVKLTVSTATCSHATIRTSYIIVNSVPATDFAGSPSAGNVPLTVSFTDQSTRRPTSWLWDFGDGATSLQQNPSHQFLVPGIYTVTLTASNACGSLLSTKVDYITAVNPTVNLTLNRPATASSSNTTKGDHAPSQAVDGDPDSYWRSGKVTSDDLTAWLRVDLGSKQSVGRAVVKWKSSYYAKKYEFQISKDDVNWTTVFAVESGKSGTREFTFTPVAARYVRLYMTKNNQGSYRINELQVYSGPSSTSKPLVVTIETVALPEGIALNQNYPNPFNSSTGITFTLPTAAQVSLKLYNLLGEEMATLVDSYRPAGTHSLNFEPQNLPTGVYFYVLDTGEVRQVRRLLLMK